MHAKFAARSHRLTARSFLNTRLQEIALIVCLPCLMFVGGTATTSPGAEAPTTTLRFSTVPTVPELYRARVFDEPLVPIGGEPDAAENTALAAALLDY